MITKIKIVVLAFMLPVFMAACGSDSGGISTSPGGTLTLFVPESGSVVEGDLVLYTITVPGGYSYDVDLQTTEGDADLAVCYDVNCTSVAGVSVNDDLVLDYVQLYVASTTTLYIYVEGWYSSRYTIIVY